MHFKKREREREIDKERVEREKYRDYFE